MTDDHPQVRDTKEALADPDNQRALKETLPVASLQPEDVVWAWEAYHQNRGPEEIAMTVLRGPDSTEQGQYLAPSYLAEKTDLAQKRHLWYALDDDHQTRLLLAALEAYGAAAISRRTGADKLACETAALRGIAAVRARLEARREA